MTSIIFTLAFIMILFLGFTTPLPLPSEEGILISFGEDVTGGGRIEPRPVEKVIKQPKVKQVESAPKKVTPTQMTQDFEEAPAVKAPKEQPKTSPVKKETVIKEEVKEKKKPVVDQRALFGRNRNTTSTSSEGEAGDEGNQGDPTGDINSDNHSLGGGVGNTPEYRLAGRYGIKLPRPSPDFKEPGVVVVQITVDQYGNVINAVPIAKGSTTLDSHLRALAQKAALSSKFNVKEGAANQVGTITYVFKLK